MRAICLAAGRSSRLLPLTSEVHKSALYVAGWPILDWQISSLIRGGITELIFVIGHGSETTRRLLKSWSTSIDIRVVENTEFDLKNLDFSVFCAREYLEGSILYLEGDLLPHPELVAALVAPSCDVVVAASKRQSSERIDTLVRREHAVFCLEFAEHGALELSGSEGEFICCVRLSSVTVKEFRQAVASCSFFGNMQLYKIFSDIMRTHTTTVVDATCYPWIEIDGPEDLDRAALVVKQFPFRPPTRIGAHFTTSRNETSNWSDS